MILTKEEAAGVLKLDNVAVYPTLDIILPAIDDYLNNATGKDWGVDTTDSEGKAIPKDPLAKMIAIVLLARWFQDTGLIGKVEDQGLIGLITQLASKV